jgi:serine/threonine-protein kinase
MGVVSLAVREADGRAVALKTVTPAADAAPALGERFLREADILRQLDHPHIVASRDLGEAGGRLYFAMDFIPGGDAAGLLRREGPLSVPRAVGLVCQLLEALEYAHGRGFVHRDVKPANLLVAEEVGREVVRVTDFGLARVYQASQLSGLSVAGQMGGTLPFMPPEQITRFREARPPADQYAAAATLYNLLTDRFPFDFPPSMQQRLLLVLQQEPVPLRTRRPDVPEGLAEVVHRALAKEPAARFPDVARMRQALRPHCE